MSTPERDDLVTDEGVDEGSRASSVEDSGTGSADTRGAAPAGGPTSEEDPHGPQAVDTPDVIAARRSAPGQELAEGEG